MAAMTWEVWDSMQGAKRGEGRGATPAEAYSDFAKAWEAEGVGTPPDDDDDLDYPDSDSWEPSWTAPEEPGWHAVNLRAPTGEWWAFGGAEWQCAPDRRAVEAAERDAFEVTDRYGIITADPNPSDKELRRRAGIQWYVDTDLIARKLDRLCRCIIHPECAGDATLARACWVDGGAARNRAFVRRSNRLP